MQKYHQISPDHLINIDAERCLDLKDGTRCFDKNIATFVDQRREEIKYDDAGRNIREGILVALVHDSAREIADAGDHHCHADRDPERPYERAPVALPNIVPAKGEPKL